MDPVQALLIGVIAPGAAAAALAVLLRRAWRGGALGAPWAAALAIALGYAVAFGLILGWPALPPVDVTQASPWLALVAAPLGALPRDSRRGLAVAATASLALGAVAGLFLAGPLSGRVLDPAETALVVAGVAASFALLDLGLALALAPLEPRAGAATTATLVGVAAAAILMSDTASLGQVTGALAAAAGALFAVGLWRPAVADLRRAAPVVAAVLAANLWSAALYASARPEVLALLVLAPWLLVAARRLLARPKRFLVALALPVMLLLVPAGAALGLAARAYFADPAPAAAAAAGDGDAPAAADAVEGYDPNYGY